MSFVEKLRASLHVSAKQEREIVNEIEQHLEEEVRTLQLQGKSSALAEQESEHSLGDALVLARAFNETHRSSSKLLQKLALRHVGLLILLYAFICSGTSLPSFFFFDRGSLFSSFVSTIVAFSFLGTPFFLLFFSSLKSLRVHFTTPTILQEKCIHLFARFFLFNAVFLFFITIVDGKIKDFITGGIALRYHWYIERFSSDLQAMFSVFLLTTFVYLSTFLFAFFLTGFSLHVSQNHRAFTIKKL